MQRRRVAEVRVFTLRSHRRGSGGPGEPSAGTCSERPQACRRGQVRCNIPVIGGVSISIWHRMCKNAISVPNPQNVLIIIQAASRQMIASNVDFVRTRVYNAIALSSFLMRHGQDGRDHAGIDTR